MVNPGQLQLVEPDVELLNNLAVDGCQPGSVGGHINLNFNQLKARGREAR